MSEPNVTDGVNFPVVRDANFVRLSIDAAYFNFIGHDVEASLTVQSQDIEAVSTAGSIHSVARLAEVGRLRMPPATALAMMHNIAIVLLHHNLADYDEILAKVDAAATLVTSNASANSDEPSE